MVQGRPAGHSRSMNETTNTPPAGGFFQWIRNLGIVRDSNDRWFAGVASGLARKAKIDPLIARGVFVVLALLGGPGLLLYLFGWLFLPDWSGKIHAEDLMRGRSTPGVVVGAIILAIAVISGLTAPWNLWVWQWDVWHAVGVPSGLTVTLTWLFWIAVVALIAYLVHRAIMQHGTAQRNAEHPEQGADHPASPATDPDPGTEPSGGSTPHAHRAGAPSAHEQYQHFGEQAEAWGKDFSDKAGAWGKDFSEKADAWGREVGEKTEAWSAEYAAKYEHTQLPRGQMLITLALALLAAGASALWAISADITVDTMLPRAAAPTVVALIAATTVLALSMIVAGARGRRSGTVGFLGFIGVVALLISIAVPWGSRYYLLGDHEITNGSPGVVALAGNMEVDLTAFDAGVATEEFAVTQVFGNIDVMVPDTRPTNITVRIGGGKVSLTETHADRVSRSVEVASGLFTNRTFHFNEHERGDLLEVTVTVGGGNVTLTDESPATERRSLFHNALEESR